MAPFDMTHIEHISSFKNSTQTLGSDQCIAQAQIIGRTTRTYESRRTETNLVTLQIGLNSREYQYACVTLEYNRC